MNIRRLLLGTLAVAGLSMGNTFASGVDDMSLHDNMSPGFGNIDDVFGFYPDDSGPHMLDEGYGDVMVVSAGDIFVIEEVVLFDFSDRPPPMIDRKDFDLPSRASPAMLDLADADLFVFGFDLDELDLGTQKHYGLGGTNAGVAPLAS